MQTTLGTLGHLPAWFSQFKCMNQRGELGAILAVFRLTGGCPQLPTTMAPSVKVPVLSVPRTVTEPRRLPAAVGG